MIKTAKYAFIAGVLVIAPLFAYSLTARAETPAKSPPVTSPGENKTEASTGGGLITFEATLVDASAKALKKTATVDVKVAAIGLVDPDTTDGKPKPGQAHLHYQLDKGPIIATTATKLSFHNLTPGQHTIMVTLAGNDHNPIGRENVLTVTIP